MTGAVLHPRSNDEVDEMIEDQRRFTRKIQANKETLRKFLMEAGFITGTGELTKRYRTPVLHRKPAR